MINMAVVITNPFNCHNDTLLTTTENPRVSATCTRAEPHHPVWQQPCNTDGTKSEGVTNHRSLKRLHAPLSCRDPKRQRTLSPGYNKEHTSDNNRPGPPRSQWDTRDGHPTPLQPSPSAGGPESVIGEKASYIVLGKIDWSGRRQACIPDTGPAVRLLTGSSYESNVFPSCTGFD